MACNNTVENLCQPPGLPTSAQAIAIVLLVLLVVLGFLHCLKEARSEQRYRFSDEEGNTPRLDENHGRVLLQSNRTDDGKQAYVTFSHVEWGIEERDFQIS